MQEVNDTECYGLASTMTTAIVNKYCYTCVQMRTTDYTWQQLLQIHLFTEVWEAELKQSQRDRKQRAVLYLGNGSSFIDGHKYFVEKSLKVVTGDAVHHEAF